MLVAAGGGGAGGTPWGMLTVQQMQTLIQNPDTERHYELLTGWKQSADLLVEHRWQVQNYRDNLASVWPPEKNAASAAYIARLDELITNLSETYEAAVSNHDAFAAATLSISLAQKEMNDLAREYESNEQLLLTHTAQQQSASANPQPTPSPSPSGEQPPVAPGRQEALHQKAVTLLSGVSADLALAQFNIQTPKPYRPNPKFDDPTETGSGGYVPPAIPPVVPSFGTEAAPSTSSRPPTAPFPTSPSVAPPGTPQPPAPQPGLVLGGANPSASPPPFSGPATLAPTVPTVSGPSPLLPGGIPPGPTAFSPLGGSSVLPPATSGAPSRNTSVLRDGLGRPGGSASGNPHVMPPGGLIGGVPGVGVAQPGGARPSPNRVNPVGGVIGGAPQGKASGVGALSPHSPATSGIYGQPNGHRRSQRQQQDHNRWDPDNPWQTESGVEPVVLPPRERRIDPGPAIGLS